jgi:hypothetical protein
MSINMYESPKLDVSQNMSKLKTNSVYLKMDIYFCPKMSIFNYRILCQLG